MKKTMMNYLQKLVLAVLVTGLLALPCRQNHRADPTSIASGLGKLRLVPHAQAAAG